MSRWTAYRGQSPASHPFRPTNAAGSGARGQGFVWALGSLVIAGWTLERLSRGLPAAALAPLFLIAGGVLLAHGRSLAALSRALRAVPCTTVRAAGTGRVRLEGRVVAPRAGALTLPSSAREAVWARVTVETLSGEDFETVVDVTASSDFLLDDGSGPPARVTASSETMVETRGRSRLTLHRSTSPPGEALQTFMARHGYEWSPGASLRVVEYALTAGETVCLVGDARREGDDGWVLQRVHVFDRRLLKRYRKWVSLGALLVAAGGALVLLALTTSQLTDP